MKIAIEKEVLEQVLEAIEESRYGAPCNRKEVRDAVSSLSNALSQPAPRPTNEALCWKHGDESKHGCAWCDKPQQSAQQEPSGEPVGFVVATRWNADGFTTRHAASFRDSAAIKAGDLLYTRPAVPLTYEQIAALHVWRYFVGLMPEHHIEITRAIEAAHKIGVI